MKKPSADTPVAPTASGRSSPRQPQDAARGERRGPGRPRLTLEALQDRIAEYSRRHGVPLSDEGLPPFPSGRRESEQHREWMALYKAHRRLADRGTSGASPTELLELVAAQRGHCAVCRKPLELADARLDAHGEGRAATHARCLQFLDLARALGADALDAARKRL